MSNSTAFGQLVGRIEDATTTLEADVLALGDASSTVMDGVNAVALGVDRVNTKALEVEQNAQSVAQDALQASQDAEQAETNAIASEQAKDTAIGAVEAAKLLAPFQEAPMDGKVYGRGDGQWVEAGSGGGAEGTVKSVNDVEPDIAGNVSIDAATVGALPSTYTPSWNDVTGKPLFKAMALEDDVDEDGVSYVRTGGAWTPLPSIPTDYNDLNNLPTLGTMSSKNDAPIDGNQYVRKDGAWSVVEAGGEAAPFPTHAGTSVKYGGGSWDEWVDANPYTQANIDLVSISNRGRTHTGAALFETAQYPLLPVGVYGFNSNSFSSGGLSGKSGAIVRGSSTTYAITEDGVYFFKGNTLWELAATEGEAVGFELERQVQYKGSVISNWPNLNPNAILDLQDFTGVVNGATMFRTTSQPSTVDWLPIASYSFKANDFPVGSPLRDLKGVITKHSNNYVVAFTLDLANTNGKWWTWSASSPTWKEVGGGSSGAVSWLDITDKPTLGTLASKDDAPNDGVGYVRKSRAWVAQSSGIEEAPTDSKPYVRKDGAWQETFPDAPVDGVAYVRKDGVWVEETAGGGGGAAQGYPLEVPIKYEGVEVNHWPELNPNLAIDIREVQIFYEKNYGQPHEWSTTAGEIFTKGFSSITKLPAGSYRFTSNTFSGNATGLAGMSGVIVKKTNNSATAFVNGTGTSATSRPRMFHYDDRSYKFQQLRPEEDY